MSMKILTILFSLVLMTSCGSLMDGMFKDLDRQERISSNEQVDNENFPDQFDQYR